MSYNLDLQDLGLERNNLKLINSIKDAERENEQLNRALIMKDKKLKTQSSLIKVLNVEISTLKDKINRKERNYGLVVFVLLMLLASQVFSMFLLLRAA